MAGFPNPALILLAPVAGVILSLTVFFMPLWHCRQDNEFRIQLSDRYRKCGGDGYNITFRENPGTKSWTPIFEGRPFPSNAELAVAVESAVRGMQVVVEIRAPESLPAADLVSVLRKLEYAGVLRVRLKDPR